MFPSGLYLIVSPHGRLTPDELCRAGLDGGARVVQLRMKDASRREVFETAERLREITRVAGACLIVNDHADIAAAVGADGVHLGQDDLPVEEARRVVGERCLIGISTHSPEQALKAVQRGADYIGFGPIFPTITKDAGPVKGLDQLRDITTLVKVPVVAIGGITRKNIVEVIAAGAHSAAIISDIAGATDVRAAVKETMELLKKEMTG